MVDFKLPPTLEWLINRVGLMRSVAFFSSSVCRRVLSLNDDRSRSIDNSYARWDKINLSYLSSILLWTVSLDLD